MPTLLQRLYRTKLALIATVFTASGLVLLIAARWDGWAWLGNLPVDDLGSALFTTGLIAVVFEYLDSKDADHRLGEAIDAKAHALRDAVIDGFATAPERLARIASPDTLDNVLRNCLTARVGAPDLAADIYSSLQWQIEEVRKPRRYDAQATLTLSPWDKGPREGLGSKFVVTTRWQYHAPSLPPLMRFSAVSNVEQYRQLLRDAGSVETWLIHPTPDNPAITEDDFTLLQCAINGQAQEIRHSSDDQPQLFTVTPTVEPDDPSGTVHVSYTHRTLVAQHGHRLFVDFATTKGLRLDFTYSRDCDIRNIDVLDYTSGTRPRIEHSPPGVPDPSISIDYGHHWTYPRSGVAFTWTLHREVVT